MPIYSTLNPKPNMFVMKRALTFNKILNPKTKCLQFHNHAVLLSNTSEKFVSVEINGEKHEFPNVWLRDNCQCSECFHPSARSRVVDWSDFNIHVKPKEVQRDNHALRVTWDDGHTSTFPFEWLQLRSFTTRDQKYYDANIYRPKKIAWRGEDFVDICSKHNYRELLSSVAALHEWLHKLSVYGVALIQNTPCSEKALDALVEKIAFPKRTHYGLKFIVQHVSNTSNVAYLSNNLQMHIDLPYYEYCPGVNMLHCLVQTESYGGDNLLSDGHYTARYMEENHPKEFKVLTDTEIEWSDVGVEDGNDFHKLYRSPVICLDNHGDIIRINFSVPQRGSHFPGSIQSVVPWYEAHSLFLKLNHKFSSKFKTTAGDILVFDNIRLLHGRNAYEDKGNNVRKLIGAYVDWDEIYSRLRCLKQKLHKVAGLET